MAGRVLFFVQNGSFEPAFQAAAMGITAAAMGDEVYFVFSFGALRALAGDRFGAPSSEHELAQSARAEELGVASPGKMLAEARALGAKVIACETTVRLCGLSAAELADRLDEAMGLASIWRLTEGAKLVSL